MIDELQRMTLTRAVRVEATIGSLAVECQRLSNPPLGLAEKCINECSTACMIPLLTASSSCRILPTLHLINQQTTSSQFQIPATARNGLRQSDLDSQVPCLLFHLVFCQHIPSSLPFPPITQSRPKNPSCRNLPPPQNKQGKALRRERRSVPNALMETPVNLLEAERSTIGVLEHAQARHSVLVGTSAWPCAPVV